MILLTKTSKSDRIAKLIYGSSRFIYGGGQKIPTFQNEFTEVVILTQPPPKGSIFEGGRLKAPSSVNSFLEVSTL